MREVKIDQLGDLGDGVVGKGSNRIFVQRTIPGETVVINDERPHAALQEVVKPSPERITALCRHFDTCGNCAAQHISPDFVLNWKQRKVADAFMGAKLEVGVEPCIPSPVGSRRRVTFTAKRLHGNVVVGFKDRASHDLTAVSQCPIVVPEIETRLDLFAGLAATIIRGGEEIQFAVTACDNGLDLDVLVKQALTEEMTAAFVRAFSRAPLLRASINGVVVGEKEKPVVRFGMADVTLPPGGFLQAVEHAEKAMVQLVKDHLKKCRRVVDLFAGSGTFALQLAANAHIHAVEMAEPALASLSSARGAQGLRPITVETRDLHDLPLMVKELKRFDGLCLDPPRAGAEAQAKEIARSPIGRVAYVSCNPTTLARDAAILVKGGYVLERVVPLDQFVFSHHVEAVALFSKKPAKQHRSIFR